MPADEQPPSSERERTDESLRVEREKADHALEAELTLIDETADAIVSKARARADQVLLAARMKTDRQPGTGGPSARAPGTVLRERWQEDRILRQERADADETLREERADEVAFLATERNETDKDLLAERARSDAALATRGEFLGIVSHDLRNMLNSVAVVAALIAEEVSRDDYVEHVRRDTQRIQRSVARMNRLIGDLIDVASIEAGRLALTCEVGNPANVVTEVVDTFQVQAAASGISLVAEIEPSPPVTFDPARILQVLTNLLGNAIKFTPTHGKVVVRIQHIDNEIRFAVSDTGMGIPTDKLEAVFERFLQVDTSDRRGVGLGLYISKCIVQGHGGRIWAESSSAGEGSTFCFTLPIQMAG
jgi:signal transduction histidine kinase